MGKLAVYKYISLLFLIATITVAIFTFIALFGGDVPPAGHSTRAMLVYAIPLLIGANLILLIYWLVRRRWHWLPIPVVTLLCCIPYVGTLYQLRSLDKEGEAKSGLKICTYNVHMFNRETTGFIAQDILTFMKKEKVDVLCMQEYNEVSGNKKNSESFKTYFPHMATGRSDMVIFSRYPITDSKNMEFEQTNNSAMWADIDIKGRNVRIFNAHLETTGINSTLRKAAKMMKSGMEVESSPLLEAFYGNYTLGMIARSGQANIVAQEIRQTENRDIIVCGDFNDVPYSYVYNTMLGNLVDGFKECGSGFMRTFRDKMVRIDYIFHNEEMKGMTYYMEELNYSDHYPVLMKLAL